MEETIDLIEYFAIIKKRFWIVILTTVIAVGISVIIFHLNKEQLYEAETTMIVNVQSNENQSMLTSDQIYDQIYAGEKLGAVYGEIIKSRAVLNPVIEKLNLTNIKTVNSRIETYQQETFDIVTSRAVASLPDLSEMSIPLVCEKGLFIPMKADAKDEIKSSQNAIKTLGGVLRDTILFKLPKDAGERTLIIIEKINKTSVKYPRKFSEIKKKPL